MQYDIYDIGFLAGYFFFQAEDGIRDPLVTGVQTCALPILEARPDNPLYRYHLGYAYWKTGAVSRARERSEERRVGKEYTSLKALDHDKKMVNNYNYRGFGPLHEDKVLLIY